MSEFTYTARTDAGERITGVVDAENEAAVVRILDEKKLFPVTILLRRGAQRVDTTSQSRRRVRATDVGTMYGQLADLIGSGVPLLRSLDSLVKSTPNPRLTQIVREVRKSVADGKSLTESLRQFPQAFPALHTAMVQAGERASFLEDVLRSLSGFVERLDELRSKVVGALIYPALLTVVGLGVMMAALIFFVPRFEPLLAEVKKPLPTELIFGMSKAVRSYWPLLIIALAVLVAAVMSWTRSRAGKRLAERWRLRIPVIGTALRMVAITRFCRILGTMLANGVPLLQALGISKNATGSTLMADQIGEATESVRAGKSLTAPLSAGGLFPEQVLAMLVVAEESNKLEKVLLQIADTVERRTNRQVDTAVRLVEPLILVAVAAGIGFMALGLLLPVFTMASSLGAK